VLGLPALALELSARGRLRVLTAARAANATAARASMWPLTRRCARIHTAAHPPHRPALSASQFVQCGGHVVATRDYHPADHCSFMPAGPFPSHCVQGTPGSRFLPPIAAALAAGR